MLKVKKFVNTGAIPQWSCMIPRYPLGSLGKLQETKQYHGILCYFMVFFCGNTLVLCGIPPVLCGSPLVLRGFLPSVFPKDSQYPFSFGVTRWVARFHPRFRFPFTVIISQFSHGTGIGNNTEVIPQHPVVNHWDTLGIPLVSPWYPLGNPLVSPWYPLYTQSMKTLKVMNLELIIFKLTISLVIQPISVTLWPGFTRTTWRLRPIRS